MKDNRQDLNRRADRRKRRLHNDATSVGGAAVGVVFSAAVAGPVGAAAGAAAGAATAGT